MRTSLWGWLGCAGLLLGCEGDIGEEEPRGETASAIATRPPNAIRGVKIKDHGSDLDPTNRCDYMTGSPDRDYGGVVKQLHGNGIYDLFIKFPQVNQNTCPRDKLAREIVEILGAMKRFNGRRPAGTPALRAWVWERTWIWKTPTGFRANKYETYLEDMTRVIEGAKAAEVDGVLEGIGAIETNLTGSDQVRRFAIKTAHDINTRTGGFLRDRTFLFPGAGMGSWFKNIDQELPDFYASMDREVKYFSFIYKFMQSHGVEAVEDDAGEEPLGPEERVNSVLEPYYNGPIANWADEVKRPADAQRPYIEKTLGFEDLAKAIRWGRAHDYGKLANVTFWGDSGDGLTVMKKGSVQLMHRLLVEELNERGHFFDFALLKSNGEEKMRSKTVLLDHPSGGVATNALPAGKEGGVQKYARPMNVFAEWDRWRLDAPGY